MFKIAYCAGHYINTPGKRIPANLDPKQTREWTLNDRVADHFARAALEYEGVQLLRTDDPTGEHFIDIPDRCKAANAWDSDLYLDMHHNAAGKIFSGGGVVAFSYPGSAKGKQYRDAIYEAVIAAGGLKGNRAQPLQEKKFDSLRLAHAPAVLMEYGFMDSKTDAPVILTDAYAKKVAYGTMEGIAKAAGLKKKAKATCTVTLPVVTRGDTGEAVKAMQILLIGHGFSCGEKGADGDYGSATEKALLAFKKKVGLTLTVNCGVQTWSALLGTK
jgi:N-acetylmuramoyl-L-alanine amidase